MSIDPIIIQNHDHTNITTIIRSFTKFSMKSSIIVNLTSFKYEKFQKSFSHKTFEFYEIVVMNTNFKVIKMEKL